MSNGKWSFGAARAAVYAIVAAVVVLAGIGAAQRLSSHRHAPAASEPVLKVGNQLGGTRALMEAAGVLKDAPYKIEWSLFPAASPLLEALAAGAVDTGGVGDAPFAFAYASGARIKAVQAYRYVGNDQASAILVPANSPLKSAQDLKGRRIATVRGSAGQDLVFRVLDRAGLKASDVRFTYLSNGDAKAALASGQVDAWSTWTSYVGIALLHDHDRSLVDATGLKPGLGFQVASDSAITNKRAQLDDFLHRLALAYDWAKQHPDAHAAVLAKETGLPADVARFTVRATYQPAPIGPDLAAEERELFERYRRAGLIAQVPDLSGAFDASFSAAIHP
jgi:sulfonate transport system substrate-binding protein